MCILAGPRLLTRLQGEAYRATEHLPMSDLRREDGWLQVIRALDTHYAFLPETELHEAIDSFCLICGRGRRGPMKVPQPLHRGSKQPCPGFKH